MNALYLIPVAGFIGTALFAPIEVTIALAFVIAGGVLALWLMGRMR